MPAKSLQKTESQIPARLYMAMELSHREWKLGFADGRGKVRRVTVEGGDIDAVLTAVAAAKTKFGLPSETPVVSCYEAGRDGFWLHRALVEAGIDNRVIDSSSIKVDRRQRRAKTDRLDVEMLLQQLIAHVRDGQKAFSVVRVPSVEDEAVRRLPRERERLKKEQKQHGLRMQSLLLLHGVRLTVKKAASVALDTLKLRDGQALPCFAREEIERERRRLALVEEQLAGLDKKQELLPTTQELPEAQAGALQMLISLRGIAETSAWVFVTELFGWRQFNNRREVAAALGLAPTPYDSGDSKREQGISKAGNGRARRMAVEIAWCWLRHQPQSALSVWFHGKFGSGGRMRRIGLVALARRLMVQLWRYVKDGVVPDGAAFKHA